MSTTQSYSEQDAVNPAAPPDQAINGPRIPPTTDAAPQSPPLAQQVQFLGEYEVLERLCSGGMGAVYKARHRRLDRLFALKLMLPADSQSSHEAAAARFEREMKAFRALDHPNVVKAAYAGEQSGCLYLAMELIDGVDLKRLVKERGPLPIAEACELVRQAALGLQHLHENDLVHRDVKPSNLMRKADGQVKVLDLGLARWYIKAEAGLSLTSAGVVVGTPDFLPPEQIEKAADTTAADIDGHADLYGLGGTLFYLLTGHVPFPGHKSPTSKLNAHRYDPPPDVRTLRPDVPEALAGLVRRLLAKKPEERPTTASAVADELVAIGAASVVVAAKTLQAKPRKPRWPWFLAAAAGVIVILVALLLYLSRSRWEHRPSSGQQGEGKPPPIHVMKLEVELSRNDNGGGRPAGLLGEAVFDPHPGDHVTVQARLTQRAFAFLIVFRPDGQVDVCFPETPEERPAETGNPRYPSTSVGREYELTDGEGLQAFALVVSSRPLPAYREWWSQRTGCPWKKEDAPPGVVYRANGEDQVEVLGKDDPRGKGARAKGKTLMAELAAWLRQTSGVETVQVLGFTVGP